MSTPGLAVSCRSLSRSFGAGDTRVPVLRGVDLDVCAGEITFLMGPSGCGKTTLISIIAAILKPDAGKVRVFGTALGGLPAGGLARFRLATIGFVFQQFNLLPALTAAENAAIPLLIQKVRGWEARARSVTMLERLGLGGQVNLLPSELSGGQQQRVAIARALVHSPKLLICDEPTAALDAASGKAVMALLREVALAAGRAVVVVTHDDRILPFADRIVRMADGRIHEPRQAAALEPA